MFGRMNQSIKVETEKVSGLCYIWEGLRRPFPLQSINVTGQVSDTNACVNISQKYVFTEKSTELFNQSKNREIECVYVFPLDEFSAVNQFDCEIDDRKIAGTVKTKNVARKEYQESINQSIPAALLEQQQENVFEVKIGAINQSNKVTVNLSYLTTLTRVGASHQLVVPMTVAPKYTPYPKVNRSTSESIGQSNVVHANTMCASCHQSPIIGVLYQCTVCKDQSTSQPVNWCEDCEDKGLHDASHPRMKIKTDQSDIQPSNQSIIQPVVRSHKPVPPHIADQKAARQSVTHNQSVHQFEDQSAKSTNMLPQSFTFDCSIETASSIQSIECPSHPNMVITRPSANQSANQSSDCTAHVSLSFTDTCSLQRDLILSINQSKPFEPRCMVEYDQSVDACTVSLSFDIAPIDQSTNQSFASEYVFLLDRSGSMGGQSIEALKQSMQLLIKSLPLTSRFQLIGFGSNFQCLFPEGSVLYTDETCEKASNYLSNIHADMGGTEIAAPLEFALGHNQSINQSISQPTNQSKLPRNIFIVTDGQVSNINQLVSMVASHRADTRVFTIGIGSAVDRALCKKLARAGAGECEFVSLDQSVNQSINQSSNDQSKKQTSDMRSKVLRQLGRAMQPMLTDVRIDWGALSTNQSINQSKHQPQQCPRQPPAVFPGTRFNTYLLDCQLPEPVMKALKDQSNSQSIPSFEYDVVITARTNESINQPINQSISQSSNQVLTMTTKVSNRHLTRGRMVSRLAARARIAELEQKHAETPFNNRSNDQSTTQSINQLSEIDSEIESLGLRFGLASRATSFIVVFKDSEQAVQTDASEDIDQSVSQSASFGSGMRSRGAPRMMMMSRAAAPMSKGAPMAHTMAFGAPGSSQSSLFRSFGACPPPPQPCAAPMAMMSCESVSSGSDDGSMGFALFDDGPAPSAAVNSMVKIGGPEKKRKALKESQSTNQSINQSLSNDLNVLFDELVLLQSASGAWKLTPKLFQITQLIKHDLTVDLAAIQSYAQSINQTIKQSEEVIATIIVLNLLKRSFADRSDDWQFMANKAQRYIDQHADAAMQQTINEKLTEMKI